ncbi:MAG: tetratricopeptide repeat protein [Gemmatimonadaceae bacterium]
MPSVTTSSLDALRKYADGIRAVRQTKYQDAAALWNEAVRLDPSFRSAYARLGGLSYFLNSPGEGAAFFAKALERVDELPERERVRIRALSESERGNHDGAIAVLAPYVTGHPNDLDLLTQLAYSYMQADQLQPAEGIYRQVIILDSLNYSARINLATIFKKWARYADAIDTYRAAFAIDPAAEVANTNMNLEYGATYVALGHADSARAVFMRMLQTGEPATRARALRSLAFLDMHLGRFTGAAAQLAEATSLASTQKALTSEVRNRVLSAQAYHQLGQVALERRQLDSALSLVRTRKEPAALLLFVGKPLARAGMLPQAAAVLKLLEESAQKDVAVDVGDLEAMRGELLVAQHQAEQALPHLRAAVQNDPPAYFEESYANGLVAAGQLDSAAVHYRAAEQKMVFGHEAQSYSESAPYWLGQVHEQRHDGPAALEAYRRYVERMKDADSSAVFAADARARITRLSGARPPAQRHTPTAGTR